MKDKGRGIQKQIDRILKEKQVKNKYSFNKNYNQG